MAQFAKSISQDIRAKISIAPPPAYAGEGVNRRMSKDEMERYEDYRLNKRRFTLRVLEELDVFNHMKTDKHYRMTVVGLYAVEDMHVIMAAAEHLMLVKPGWKVTRGFKEHLDDTYIRDYVECVYQCGHYNIQLDDDYSRNVPLYVAAGRRREIWMSLFEAAGYVVRWGGVLNVRRATL